MWLVAGVLLYLAVYKKFEPLLLVPIAFGALLANLPTKNMTNAPAGEILSPVDGIVILSTIELGQEISLPTVRHEMPNSLGRLKKKTEALELLESEIAKATSGEQSLLYIVRPTTPLGSPMTDYETIEVSVNGAPLTLQATDQLIWADANASVSPLRKRSPVMVIPTLAPRKMVTTLINSF